MRAATSAVRFVPIDDHSVLPPRLQECDKDTRWDKRSSPIRLIERAVSRFGVSSDHAQPVIEPSNGGAAPADLTTRALHLRIRQQEILAELGVLALQGKPFIDLLNHTARLAAEGMEAEFCKVLEYIPAENRFLVRAGVGWHEGIVGVATVGADLESPSGFALRTGKPVISNHLENEQRFRTPELLVEHGIRRAMNVILQGDGSPYGVLEVDSRAEGEFSEHDIAFLQGAANILGMAIERQRYEQYLKVALDRHQVLLKEISHRVKNSLQIVSSMLHLQASTADEERLSAQLTEASSRVSAIGRAYERLAYDADIENIDLGAYLQAVCADAITASSNCKIHFDGVPGIRLYADRAISLALIVNELVTNAGKYAFQDDHEGHIYVRLVRQDANTALVSVRDDGIGLPPHFDLSTSKGLGMRIVTALAMQLGADIKRTPQVNGNEFVVTVPV
jgi:two-component sensor histidine kinase